MERNARFSVAGRGFVDRRKVRMLILGAWFLSFAGGAWAQLEAPISAPAVLNSDAVTDNCTGETGSPELCNGDTVPAIATDGEGKWVAVWRKLPSEGSLNETAVRFSESTDDGAHWTAVQDLDPGATMGLFAPFASIGSDGNDWIVVLERDDVSTFTSEIVAYRSSGPELDWSDATVIHGTSMLSGNSSAPQLATDRKGVWVVVWTSTDPLDFALGADPDILFSRTTDDGLTWSPAQPLHAHFETDLGEDIEPHVATDGAGVWVVTWDSTDDLSGSVGTDRDVFFSRSTNNGESWTEPRVIHDDLASDFAPDKVPSVAVDETGTWISVWQVEEVSDVVFSRSDDGETWNAPQPLTDSTTTLVPDTRPRVYSGNAHWIVVWSTIPSLSNTDRDVLVSASVDGGSNWTAPELLNTNGNADSGSDLSVASATDGQGNWVSVWQSFDTLGDTVGVDGDILTATFSLDSPDGGPSPVPDGSIVPGALMSAALDPDGAGIDVTWDVTTCVADDYNVLIGDLKDVAVLQYTEAVCGLGNSGSATIPVPSGDGFFLIVAVDESGTESLHGFDSDGNPRVADAGGFCGVVAQSPSTACP